MFWHCCVGARKGIRPEWWGAGVVVCLERCVDLHMAQLMPLPLTVSCFSKIQIGFTFLVPAHLGSCKQRAVKSVCVCVVCVCDNTLKTACISHPTEFSKSETYRAKLSVSSTRTGFIWHCISSTSAGTASLLTEHMALDSSSLQKIADTLKFYC